MFSVIIPSRNIANLKPCMAAVRECEPDARLIVIDDGLDGVDWPRPVVMRNGDCSPYPSIEIRDGIKPFIFSRNVNLGIVAAGSDDVVILNDDALLQTPGGFSLLARECEAHPEYGIIASTCNNVGNNNQWNSKLIEALGGGRFSPVYGLRDEPRMVCFVCVYIPRRTIEAVGLLDEDFTGYGVEDDEYCLRIRQAGLKIGIHDGCYVDHGSLTSSFRGAAGAGGDFRPNLKIFIQKYGVDNWNKTKETSDYPQLFP